MKYTEINGHHFETTRSKYAEPAARHHSTCWTYGDIYDAYERPSAAKCSVFNDWRTWADACECVHDMRITSRNTFAFTLGAYYTDPETGEVIGYISITRDHNRLMLFK